MLGQSPGTRNDALRKISMGLETGAQCLSRTVGAKESVGNMSSVPTNNPDWAAPVVLVP